MGLSTEIFFSARLASFSATNVYVTSAPFFWFLMRTLLKMKTLLLSMSESSMTRALAKRFSILLILASNKPWASFAASYSAFSLKSPLSRASAICWLILGRSTVFIWCNSSFKF